MDNVDEAQKHTQRFEAAALANRQDVNKVVAPLNTSDNGVALCIVCDIEIDERRKVLPSAQRCIDCQTDFEKRKSI